MLFVCFVSPNITVIRILVLRFIIAIQIFSPSLWPWLDPESPPEVRVLPTDLRPFPVSGRHISVVTGIYLPKYLPHLTKFIHTRRFIRHHIQKEVKYWFVLAASCFCLCLDWFQVIILFLQTEKRKMYTVIRNCGETMPYFVLLYCYSNVFIGEDMCAIVAIWCWSITVVQVQMLSSKWKHFIAWNLAINALLLQTPTHTLKSNNEQTNYVWHLQIQAW